MQKSTPCSPLLSPNVPHAIVHAPCDQLSGLASRTPQPDPTEPIGTPRPGPRSQPRSYTQVIITRPDYKSKPQVKQFTGVVTGWLWLWRLKAIKVPKLIWLAGLVSNFPIFTQCSTLSTPFNTMAIFTKLPRAGPLWLNQDQCAILLTLKFQRSAHSRSVLLIWELLRTKRSLRKCTIRIPLKT